MSPVSSNQNNIRKEPVDGKGVPSWATLDLKTLTARQKIAIVTFIFIVACLVGMRIWADNQVRNLPAPIFVTVATDRIAVSWGERILIYDYAGNSAGDLSLPQGTVLSHLAYDTDGSLWIGDYETKQILRLGDGQWQTVVNGSGAIKATFKFVRFPQTGDIFVTDTSNHRILVYSADGRLSRILGKEGKEPGELKFPNEIVLFEQNLLVVNTNASRLDLFAPDGSFLKTVGTVAESGQYLFPTMMTLANGEIALLLTTDLFNARAVVYDLAGKRTGEYIPPRHISNAGDIAYADGKVIITDRDARQVYAFDAVSRQYLGPLNEALSALSLVTNQQARMYSFISVAAVGLLLLICLTVAVFFARFSRQQTRGRELIESQRTKAPGTFAGAREQRVSATPRTQTEKSWKPVVLSVLFPGLGQFYNREIVKGGILAAFFSAQIVLLTKPFFQLIDGSAEVTPGAVPVLLSAFVTLGLTWILGIADAWRNATRRND